MNPSILIIFLIINIKMNNSTETKSNQKNKNLNDYLPTFLIKDLSNEEFEGKPNIHNNMYTSYNQNIYKNVKYSSNRQLI